MRTYNYTRKLVTRPGACPDVAYVYSKAGVGLGVEGGYDDSGRLAGNLVVHH